jgi:hypothetical protein
MFLLRHLITTAFKAFFRMVFFGLCFAAIGGATVLIVAYANVPHWPPSALTIAAAIAVAVLAGYASALTVLVREAVRGVRAAEHDIVNAAEGVAEREKAHA